MKKLCLVNPVDISDEFYSLLSNVDITIVSSVEEASENYDLIALFHSTKILSHEFVSGNNVINIHKSLLPAFDTENPVKDAYLAGVKVTGVTVFQYKNNDKKILAQYPVLLDNYTHYDDLENELKEIELKLYPLVIKSILEDKIFDIVELLSPSNHGCSGCGGCGNCH